MRVHQAEHALDVGERLADLAVEHAEEVERDVELDHEGIDQHDVADRHLAAGHAVGRLPHHRRHGDCDDRRLADVQRRQRVLVGDLRLGPLLQLLVVAPGLELFVVEILHRLVVDQAVDRARVGGGIELVGLAPQRGAPVGHLDGEHDVDRQRAERDEREHRVVIDQQDADHHADLDQRGQDGIQRVADQRADRTRAALDVAREPAGLAFEVEAQRQRVQVAEHAQRDLAHRLLGHACEHHLAQFGQQRGGEAQRAIGQQQRRRHHDEGLLGRDREAVDQVLEDDRH